MVHMEQPSVCGEGITTSALRSELGQCHLRGRYDSTPPLHGVNAWRLIQRRGGGGGGAHGARWMHVLARTNPQLPRGRPAAEAWLSGRPPLRHAPARHLPDKSDKIHLP